MAAIAVIDRIHTVCYDNRYDAGFSVSGTGLWGKCDIMDNQINYKALLFALSELLQQEIVSAGCEAELLQGGTVGKVQLLTGKAETADGEKLPYKLVNKTQQKWVRYDDPDSWRREYDLYQSGLGELFTDGFRWPRCYHAELYEDKTEIWMEYIDGISGLDLTPQMYEQAAYELGRFQGRLQAEKPALIQNLTNLSKLDYAKNFYLHYRSWPEVYDYIRSNDCEIPKHLCELLIGVDNHAEDIFRRIAKLPVVLCHRDFWVANIFSADDKIRIIDWDTTGWGYLGEDIASLIADEADTAHMIAYYQKCIPAYYRGFSEYTDVSGVDEDCIYELSLILFGYRLVEWYKYAGSPEDKALHLDVLQKLYEMAKL